MQKLIKLRIEKFIEKDEEYFVGTSDDLEGLVAEGKTIKEVVEIAEDIAKILLELEQKNSIQVIAKELPNIIEYPLSIEV